MYGTNNCGYTVKMRKQLQNDGAMKRIMYIDIDKNPNEWKKVSLEYDHNGGVPFFISPKTRKYSVGFKPTSQLFQELNM